MRFVPVPADADSGVVFGAENLLDARCRTAKCLDLSDQWIEPFRNRDGLLKPAQRIVVAKPERRDPALAFVLAELERLQRQCSDLRDQFPLDLGRDEIGGGTQTLGRGRPARKKP